MADGDSKDHKKDSAKNAIALAEYKEVATQFRKLTDIRFKLLTYLPVGTAAAAVFVSKDNELLKHPEISAFAFVVTLCIATYDKRNDQHYDELVARAAELERELDIKHGSFMHRPKSWLKYGFVPVEHRWPIGVVYAAAAALWAYLFAAALGKDQLWPKIVAEAVVIGGWLLARSMESDRKTKLRKAVKSLMKQLLETNAGDEQATQAELVDKIAKRPVLGIDKAVAQQRVQCHWREFEEAPDASGASALLAAVIDLPARWIEDVWTGRR